MAEGVGWSGGNRGGFGGGVWGWGMDALCLGKCLKPCKLFTVFLPY